MTFELESLRDRVLQLLEQERRAMHTGEIAGRLGVLTHEVHSAMHTALHRGLAWFRSSEGYGLPVRDPQRTADDAQTGMGF